MSNTTTNPEYKRFTRFSQFQAVRRSNPNLYHSSAFQVAMHDLAQKYGVAFFEDAPSNSNPSNISISSLTSAPVSPLDRSEKTAALRRVIEEATEHLDKLENEGTEDDE
jgi:hypothetical protein